MDPKFHFLQFPNLDLGNDDVPWGRDCEALSFPREKERTQVIMGQFKAMATVVISRGTESQSLISVIHPFFRVCLIFGSFKIDHTGSCPEIMDGIFEQFLQPNIKVLGFGNPTKIPMIVTVCISFFVGLGPNWEGDGEPWKWLEMENPHLIQWLSQL